MRALRKGKSLFNHRPDSRGVVPYRFLLRSFDLLNRRIQRLFFDIYIYFLVYYFGRSLTNFFNQNFKNSSARYKFPDF